MSSHSSVFFSQLASDFDGTVSRLLQTSAVCTTVITITISHKPTSSNCHRYHQFNALWILKGLESSSFNLVQVRKVQEPGNFFKSTPGGFWGVLCTATDVLLYIKCRRDCLAVVTVQQNDSCAQFCLTFFSRSGPIIGWVTTELTILDNIT